MGAAPRARPRLLRSVVLVGAAVLLGLVAGFVAGLIEPRKLPR